MRNFFFFLAIALVIIASFFLYSQSHSPILNSDSAISVLMTYDLKLPADLYFWGQDRGGSLIPLLARFFYKVCHFTPLNSVSIVNYLLLIIGFIGFAGLLKTRFSILIFSLLWFLPSLKFIELDCAPVTMQYCLIGISVFMYSKLESEPGGGNAFKQHLFLTLIILLLILSVWVSDSALITIFLLVTVLFLFDRKKLKNTKLVFIYLISGLVAGACFIFYAKSQAIHKTGDYLKVNSIHSILESLAIIKNTFIDLLLFRSSSNLMSLHLYGILILLIIIMKPFFRLMTGGLTTQHKWMLFFLADSILVFLAAVLSRWVFLNGTPARYFLGCYISFAMFLLLAIEKSKLEKRKHTIVNYVLFMTVFFGSVSAPWFLKNNWTTSLNSQAGIFSELKSLGRIGVIAEYWHSYIAAVNDPAMIKATPHDKEVNRNPGLTEEVFAQPNLYVFRFDWIDSFPDTLKQYGHVLVREGEPFIIAGCDVSKYRKMD